MHKIKKYDATSTDAPFLPPSATKEFYARQATKLPRGHTRRLLIYPIEKLVTELISDDRFKNLEDFVRLHKDYGFELRYWPYTIKELRERLNILMGETQAPRLVDFGIINDELVFGQAAEENDTNKISGRGYITWKGAEIHHYIDMFDELWERTKPECYPSAQLNTLVWLCQMRSRRLSQVTSTAKKGRAFFAEIINKIKSSKKLQAIDIAKDMTIWWRSREYQEFLKATIEAASSNHASCSRMYFIRRSFITKNDAQLFVKKIIEPQVNGGIKIGIACFDSIVDKNLGIIDCILNEDEWGFYLLPGDSFSEDKVDESHNLIEPCIKKDLERLYDNVANIVSVSGGWLLEKSLDIQEDALVDWLENRPSKK
jgi:hypothetical protein